MKVNLRFFFNGVGAGQSSLSWPYLKDVGHLALLRKGAVVLNGQDDRHVRVDKGAAVNRFHHILRRETHVLRLQLFRKIAGPELWNRTRRSHFVHYLERYFGGERVSVIDDGHAVIAVPTVQFHTPAALQQHLQSGRQQSCFPNPTHPVPLKSMQINVVLPRQPLKTLFMSCHSSEQLPQWTARNRPGCKARRRTLL